jgi:hypothetical protein
MKPANKTVVQNRRGRPPTGQDPVSAIRLPHNLTAAIDYWAAHNGATSRSEAIRRLVEIGSRHHSHCGDEAPKLRRRPWI